MSAARDVILNLLHGVETKHRVKPDDCRLVYGPGICSPDGPMLALIDRTSPTQLRFCGFPVAVDERLDANAIELRRDGRVLAGALITRQLAACAGTRSAGASRSRPRAGQHQTH